ncbi:MAG: ABC transporter permease, partial [Ilumatobacteraceae bacterium]
PEAGNVLMALVLASIYLGASNAVREIVKERAVLRREQNFGLSVTAYLGSKVLVLGTVTVAQAALLVVLGTARQGGPADGVWFLPGETELVAIVVVTGLSALCLGLLISAFVESADKAMTLLPVMLFAQFLMAGLIFPVATLGIQQLSWLTTARWGFAGASSTADFWTLRGCASPAAPAQCSTLWQHAVAPWLLSYGMLCLLALGALALAWRAIVRRDPAEILRRNVSAR